MFFLYNNAILYNYGAHMPNNSTGKPRPQCPVSDEALIEPIEAFWPRGNIPYSLSELYPSWVNNWLLSPAHSLITVINSLGNYSTAEPEIQADFRDATNYIEERLESRLTFTESSQPLSGSGIVLSRCSDFNRDVGGFAYQRLGLDGFLYQSYICIENKHPYTNYTKQTVRHELLHSIGISDVSQLGAPSSPHYPDVVRPLTDSRNGIMCSVLPYLTDFHNNNQTGICRVEPEDLVFSCQPPYLTEYGIIDDRLLELAYVDRQYQGVFGSENAIVHRLASSFVDPFLLGLSFTLIRNTIKSSIAPEREEDQKEDVKDTRQQKLARIIADVSIMVLLITSEHANYTGITHMALSLFSLLPERALNKLPEILPKTFRSPYHVSNFLTLFSLGIRASAITENPVLSLASILSGVVANRLGNLAGKEFGNALGKSINSLATKSYTFFQQHCYSSGSQDSSSLLADASEAPSYGAVQI
jgi:hypothetical protein